MNYELAKELKDAGFPQTGGGYTPDHGGDEESWAYYPALEELIKACGDDLSHIAHRPGYPKDGHWWAVTHSRFDENGNNYEYSASTPTEAVARLWLALNKKI